MRRCAQANLSQLPIHSSTLIGSLNDPSPRLLTGKRGKKVNSLERVIIAVNGGIVGTSLYTYLNKIVMEAPCVGKQKKQT